MESSETRIAAATGATATAAVIALAAGLRHALPGAQPTFVLAIALGAGVMTFLVNRSLLARRTTVDDGS